MERQDRAPQVPCPVCGLRFAWPPTRRCPRCEADLTGSVAAELWQVAREEAQLRARGAALRRALAATATAPQAPQPPTHPGPRSPSPPSSQPASPAGSHPPPAARSHAPRVGSRLGELGAQTILGLAGAALLTVAAVVFAAVAWEDLPAVARAAVLVAAAAAAGVTSWWLDRRRLHVTAGATGLLADALAATVVWAAHSYGATGALSDAGGTALAALAATATAVGLRRVGVSWQRPAAVAAWLTAVASAAGAVIDVVPRAAVPAVVLVAAAAATAPSVVLRAAPRLRLAVHVAGAVALALATTLAVVVTAATDGPATALPVVTGVVAAGVWLRTGRWGAGAATATLTWLAGAVVATLEPAAGPLVAAFATITFVTVGLAARAGPSRRPVLAGTVPVALPPTVWTVVTVGALLDAWVGRLDGAWQGAEAVTRPVDGWFALVPVLLVGAAVAASVQLRPARAPGLAVLLAPFAASASLWWLGGPVPALTTVAAAGAALGAWWGRTSGRWALVVGAVAAVGWMAPSPGGSAVVALLGVVLAGSAGWAPVGRRVEHAVLVVALSAVAGGGLVVAGTPAHASAAVAGTVAVVAAVAAATAGRRLRLDAAATAFTVAAAGGTAAAVTGGIDGAAAAAVVTAAVTVAAVALGMRWRTAPTAARVYAATAAAAATATSWLLLSDAGVEAVEAYTALPCLLALVAGTVWMRRDPSVASVRALQPGLALLTVPTLLQLLADPADVPRAVAAAVLGAVLLLAGVTWRVAAPVWYGAAAVVTVVLTQLVVVAAHVPRWVTFAVVGGLLVVGSATFERQRLRVRRIGGYVSEVADHYR